jgi:hypothetical protein
MFAKEMCKTSLPLPGARRPALQSQHFLYGLMHEAHLEALCLPPPACSFDAAAAKRKN